MKSRRASRRSSAEPRLLKAASDAASSQRRRVGKKTIAGSKLYDPSAANKFAGGISGMRSFMSHSLNGYADRCAVRFCLTGTSPRNLKGLRPQTVGVAQRDTGEFLSESQRLSAHQA